MPIDPLLLRKFHKPGSNVPVPPRPASPPSGKPADDFKETHSDMREHLKDIVEVLKEGGFKIAFDIPAKEPPVEGGGHAPETLTESETDGAYMQEMTEAFTEEQANLAVLRAAEEPIDSKEITVFVEPKAAEGAGPAFKDRLEKLDSLIQSDLGISPYTIDMIRGHVKQIMIDLQTQPELDAILIDRDVHNVLAFIRHVKVDAIEAREKTAVKKEVKQKKDSKFRNFTLDLSALQEAFAAPKSLTDLSKLK